MEYGGVRIGLGHGPGKATRPYRRTWQETTVLGGQVEPHATRMGELLLEIGTVNPAYRALDTYAAVRLRRWLRSKHKLRPCKGGAYPLSHLYGHFGLVRLSRLGHDVPWVKA